MGAATSPSPKGREPMSLRVWLHCLSSESISKAYFSVDVLIRSRSHQAKNVRQRRFRRIVRLQTDICERKSGLMSGGDCEESGQKRRPIEEVPDEAARGAKPMLLSSARRESSAFSLL